jgi:hypothetical protein
MYPSELGHPINFGFYIVNSAFFSPLETKLPETKKKALFGLLWRLQSLCQDSYFFYHGASERPENQV